MKNPIVRINPVIRFVFFTNSAYAFSHGLVIPFFAVFASTHLRGGNITVASLASGIFLTSIGFSQLAGGFTLDRVRKKISEKFLFYLFTSRYILMSICLAALMLVNSPWHLYIVQGAFGLVIGLTQPLAHVIQTRYMDVGKEGYEWGISGFIFNVFSGLSAFLSGLIIAHLGFKPLFLFGALFNLIAAAFAGQTLREYVKMERRKTRS